MWGVAGLVTCVEGFKTLLSPWGLMMSQGREPPLDAARRGDLPRTSWACRLRS